jgi:outer membrane immunogenic protein
LRAELGYGLIFADYCGYWGRTEMRKELLCGVATLALVVAISGPVAAADLPVKAPVAVAPVAIPTTWAGFYLGGHIGYGWSKMDGQESGGDQFADSLKLNGLLVGVHGGYNWQYSQLVFGVEGDISGAFGNGWSKDVCTVDDPSCRVSGSASMLHGEMHGLASIRGRLGWAFDRTLIYATGGWGWGNYRGLVTSGSSINPISTTVSGGVVGGGVEWKYNPNLSFRVEGLYYMFNKTLANLDSEPSEGGSFTIHPVSVIRLGASYHF